MQKTNTKTNKRRSRFTAQIKHKLVGQFQAVSKTNFFTTIAASTMLLEGNPELYDDMIDFCYEMFRAWGGEYVKATDPQAIIQMAETIKIGLEAVYRYYIKW